MKALGTSKIIQFCQTSISHLKKKNPSKISLPCLSSAFTYWLKLSVNQKYVSVTLLFRFPFWKEEGCPVIYGGL